MLYFSVILLMACAIGSLNVNGLREYHKRDLLFNYLTIDLGKTFHETTQSTYYHKGLRKKSRIDYILASENIAPKIKQISVEPTSLSDHNTIIVRIENVLIKKGPGRWICGKDLLTDEICKQKIKWFWNFWKTQKIKYKDIMEWWDLGKNRLKEIMKAGEKTKYFQSRKEKYQLDQKYEFLVSNPDITNKPELDDIEKKLKAFEEKIMGKSKTPTPYK